MRILIPIFLTTLIAMGCASTEKQLGEKVDVAARRLQHLAVYKDMQCEVKVKFAEPTKTAWLRQIPVNNKFAPAGGGKNLFQTLDTQVFDWRITPYRCRVASRRSGELPTDVKTVLSDTEKKLDTILCVWMQSFYGDSPLRGWRKNESKVELAAIPNGVKLIKGFQRALEVYGDGEKVVARMGPDNGSLTGNFVAVGEHLYPQTIEQQNGNQLNRLQDFNYSSQEGREVPSTFWLNLANQDGLPNAYMQVQTNACTIR